MLLLAVKYPIATYSRKHSQILSVAGAKPEADRTFFRRNGYYIQLYK